MRTATEFFSRQREKGPFEIAAGRRIQMNQALHKHNARHFSRRSSIVDLPATEPIGTASIHGQPERREDRKTGCFAAGRRWKRVGMLGSCISSRSVARSTASRCQERRVHRPKGD